MDNWLSRRVLPRVESNESGIELIVYWAGKRNMQIGEVIGTVTTVPSRQGKP